MQSSVPLSVLQLFILGILAALSLTLSCCCRRKKKIRRPPSVPLSEDVRKIAQQERIRLAHDPKEEPALGDIKPNARVKFNEAADRRHIIGSDNRKKKLKRVPSHHGSSTAVKKPKPLDVKPPQALTNVKPPSRGTAVPVDEPKSNKLTPTSNDETEDPEIQPAPVAIKEPEPTSAKEPDTRTATQAEPKKTKSTPIAIGPLQADQNRLYFPPGGGVQQLKIKNTSPATVAILVEVSDPDKYAIKPNCTFVEPGDTQELAVKRSEGGSTSGIIHILFKSVPIDAEDPGELFRKNPIKSKDRTNCLPIVTSVEL